MSVTIHDQLVENYLWIYYYKMIDLHDFNTSKTYYSDPNRPINHIFNPPYYFAAFANFNYSKSQWQYLSPDEKNAVVSGIVPAINPYYFDTLTAYFTKRTLLTATDVEVLDRFITVDSYMDDKRERLYNFIDFITIFNLCQMMEPYTAAKCRIAFSDNKYLLEKLSLSKLRLLFNNPEIVVTTPLFLSDLYYITMDRNDVKLIYDIIVRMLYEHQDISVD